MLVEKWMLQAGNCLLKNGRRRTSIAFYNLEMVIRHKNRMKAEALLCRNVVGMLFNFIGNTVIHSCVKVELSYEIKNAPRGCAARGKENIALRTDRARRISQARFFFITGECNGNKRKGQGDGKSFCRPVFSYERKYVTLHISVRKRER